MNGSTHDYVDEFSFDPRNGKIGTGRMDYQYGYGYLHDGSGTSIVSFVDRRSGMDYAFGFDGQYADGAWDATPATYGTIAETEDYVEIPVATGRTHKIDRLYRRHPVLEIIYQRNDAEWTEDFIRAPGPEERVAFVMYGMRDVCGVKEGKRLWSKAEARFGHNHGDHFLAAAGTSVSQCTYEGHFIYGVVDHASGHGVGFVYPTWISTHNWKVWWTEPRKLEIEYAPQGDTGRRWIFPVTGGRPEIMQMGMRLARNGHP